MPSGYTYKIVEGEQPFEDFFWHCARAMGCFIHMRDDPMDAPLRFPAPEFTTRGSQKKIDERAAAVRRDERELRDLEAKTDAQIEAEFVAYKREGMEYYEKEYARKKPIHDRVTRLRSQVADWVPPTEEHEGFKTFMLQQIDTTTDWDAELPKKPTFPDSAQEWHENRVSAMRTYVARTKELHQSEVDSPDVQSDRIAFIKRMIDSVPPPPGRFAEGELDKA